MMINAIVVSGMGEDATLPRMGCPVRFAGKKTKAADRSPKKQNAWYFLRIATNTKRLEEYNRTSHVEDASRQTARVFLLTQAIHNVTDVKKQDWIATGTWMERNNQQRDREEDKLKKKQGMKISDLNQSLEIRNVTGAPQK
jgi:hypothetical protein